MAKYLDDNGLLYFWQKIKSVFVTDVTYDSSTKKIQKSKNGSASDVVTLATVATSGSYNDLSNKPTIPSAVPKTSTTPKMNGTAAIGSETAYAAGDHVHPVDTSRAPTSHASSATTYGTGTDANYGHLKLSDSTSSTSSTSGGVAASPKAVKDALDAAKAYVDALDTGVSDVKMGNTSIVSNGVATIPNPYYYGVCSTAASTTAKTVSIPGVNALVDGLRIFVKFSSNTATSATLNVNSLGAKDINIQPRGGTVIAMAFIADAIHNRVAELVYDLSNTQWLVTNYSFNADWNVSDTTLPSYIKNKPTIPTLKNVFGKVKVGSSTIEADTTQDTLELAAGSNITLTPDTSNDKVTIAATNTTYSDFTGATASAAGTHGLVPAPEGGDDHNVLIGGGNFVPLDLAIDANNKTIDLLVGEENVASVKLAAGSNVSITPNESTNTFTIAATNTTYSAFSGASASSNGAAGLVPKPLAGDQLDVLLGDGSWCKLAAATFSDTDHLTHTVKKNDASSGTTIFSFTVPAVNTSTGKAGVMLPADKTKLDSIVMSNGKIDSSVLPSYVDDVIEAYARSGQTALSQNWLATGSASGTVITPESGKIYILMADSGDYAANTQFRWGGTAYVKLADGGVSAITNSEIDTIVAS